MDPSCQEAHLPLLPPKGRHKANVSKLHGEVLLDIWQDAGLASVADMSTIVLSHFLHLSYVYLNLSYVYRTWNKLVELIYLFNQEYGVRNRNSKQCLT